jgi:hypothetical protein
MTNKVNPNKAISQPNFVVELLVKAGNFILKIYKSCWIITL